MASTTQRRVAVVGSAQTLLADERPDLQHVDLITEVVTRALKGTGIRVEDIDFVIDSGSDFLDGRSISNCGFLGAMAAHHKEESRVEEDGLWALSYAVNKLTAGPASIGLVIGYSKPSEGDVDAFWSGMLEPFLQRPVGLTHETAAGLYAQSYLATAGLNADDLDVVSDSAWRKAAANPRVCAPTPSGDDWRSAVASPLRRSDYARPVDGAVAILLAIEEVAEQTTESPVWVTGVGSAIDQHFLAGREPDTLPAAGYALRSALRMAGLASAADFDIVEVSATSTVGELMVLEALDVAEPYKAIELYRSDDPRINPSGGALPADVIMATGLARLHESVLRLARRGEHHDNTARTALVHGTGGFAMQNHCVVTLEVA